MASDGVVAMISSEAPTLQLISMLVSPVVSRKFNIPLLKGLKPGHYLLTISNVKQK